MTLDNGLSPDAQDWHDEIAMRYDLTDGGRVLLHQAAALRDRITEAEEAIKHDGFMLTGKNGSYQVHPAARIAQDARSLLLRTLTTLGLQGPHDS
jgi:hypothetical protein